MNLPAADRQALQKDIDEGKTRLVWLTLWDDYVQDGDVVEISSNGFSRVIALTNPHQSFAMPLPANGKLAIRGIRDGGGGITVAAMSDNMPLPIPVMAPGEVIEVPVVAP